MATKKAKKSSRNTNVKQQVSFSSKQVGLFVALFVALGIVVVLQSLAAPASKGGRTVLGTATIGQPIIVRETDKIGVVSYGDAIRFNVTYNNVDYPFVHLQCYDPTTGALLSQSTEGYYPSALDDGIFGLSSPVWTTGAANCTAKVEQGDANTRKTNPVLATVNFHVDAETPKSP